MGRYFEKIVDGSKKKRSVCLSNHYFFSVPIYIKSENRYFEDRKNFIEQKLNTYKDYGVKIDNRKEVMADQLAREYGGGWRYNQIVGYVKLYFYGDQVRGDLYYQRGQRIRRVRRNRIEYKFTNILTGYPIKITCSSKDIFEIIMKSLDEVQNKDYLRDRFVDVSDLKVIGPHINWKDLFLGLLKYNR